MENLKLAIIYYSATGTNYRLAQVAEEAAKKAGVGEVKLLKIKEIAPEEAIAANEDWQKHYNATKNMPTATVDDLDWADSIIFSFPTRYGNMPSQVQQFLDMTGGLWFNGKLANKVVSGMTSASNPHGGQEATLLALYKTMKHWGAIVAAPGYTDESIFAAGGNPYGVSLTAGKEEINDTIKKAIEHQVKRTVQVAGWIKKGMTES